MIVHGEKTPGIAKNVIGDVLADGEDVGHDRALEDTAPVVFKADDHDCILMAAQRFRVPVLSGAAVVAVEEIDVSGQVVAPVRCSRVHFYGQRMQVDRAGVRANIVFLHQKNFAFRADILLVCHDSGGGDIDKQAWIVQKFCLVVPLFAEYDHSVRIFPVDIFCQRAGFCTAVCEIVPVFLPLEGEQEHGKPLAGDKGDRGAEQGHHDARGHQQENDANRLAEGRHRRQITVADGGQRDQGVPERISKGLDRRAAVTVFGQAEYRQQDEIDDKQKDGHAQVDFIFSLHESVLLSGFERTAASGWF